MYRIKVTFILPDGTESIATIAVSGRQLNHSNWRERIEANTTAYAERHGIKFTNVTYDISPLITAGILF